MTSIADFSPSAARIVRTTPRQRHGHDVEFPCADSENRLSASDRKPTACPVVFRQQDGGNCVTSKRGDLGAKRHWPTKHLHQASVYKRGLPT